MSEPVEVADAAEQVAPGIWHWQIENSAIGGATSSSHLFDSQHGAVMIDPVRLGDDALAGLPAPTAILLTSKGHQRAAWRYREQFDAEVWAPAGTPPPDGQPDQLYRDGDSLPGGFRAVQTPGPSLIHFCLLRAEPPGALVCADLLMGDSDGGLRFVPLEYHDDPSATRRSVETLLELPFALLCLDHGRPIADGKAAIRALLAADGASR
ncbi:MAG: hypothetical protein QOE17_1234 [Gaiellales bacterium]|nr:hypothetical protein [Gaiellales bacterium]